MTRAHLAALHGPWAMDPAKLEAMCSAIESIPSDARAMADPEDGESDSEDIEKPYEVVGNVALIAIRGVMMSAIPWYYAFFGLEATNTNAVRAALALANEDPDVATIALMIDSPGGMVSGVAELGDDVFASRKPICAVGSGMVCSAAYWVASQARTFVASQTARVGSIGVYSVLEDSSRAFENEGVSRVLVSSGPLKGQGTPGVKLAPAAVEAEQRLVDQAAAVFRAAVSRGRRMEESEAARVATGGCWMGAEAVGLRLVDGLGGLAAGLAGLDKGAPWASIDSERPNLSSTQASAYLGDMDDQIQATTQAKINELEAALAAEREKAAKAEAQAKIAASALAQITDDRRKAAIEVGVKAGRITPPMRAHVEEFAKICGERVGDLEAFIATLPVQTRAEAIGVAPPAAQSAASAASDADRQAMVAFGVSLADIRAAESVDRIALDRKATLKSGQVSTMHDLFGAR